MPRRPTAQQRIEDHAETPFGDFSRTRNRKLRLRQVVEILHERGVEPIGAICDALPSLNPSMQVKTLLSLSEFVYPKLGRTEVTGRDGGPVEASITLEVRGVPAGEG